MCWQPISLKDPGSQELLDAVEHERTIRMNPPRNTTIFHHPILGDFELEHLPVSATESELEERIIQHLAAAAAMGRARHIARREGQRGRSSAQSRPHFLVFNTNPNTSPVTATASPPTLVVGGGPEDAIITASGASPLFTVGGDSTQLISASSGRADQVPASASGSSSVGNQHEPLNNSQERAGPSDYQTFSESLKSRFSAMSMRYEESITKSTKGWKERLFSRNSSTQVLGSEVRRESNTGVDNMTDVMEHLETRENRKNDMASVSNSHQDSLSPDEANQQHAELVGNLSVTEDSVQAPCAASSASH